MIVEPGDHPTTAGIQFLLAGKVREAHADRCDLPADHADVDRFAVPDPRVAYHQVAHSAEGYAPRVVELLPLEEAAALLDAVWSGTGTEELGDPPLIAVDIDSAASTAPAAHSLRPPALWPGTVVAVGAGMPNPPPGADMYLARAADPPRPWVGAPATLQDIVSSVVNRPRAAAVLAQVMRLHSGDVARDLATESLAYAVLQWGDEHRSWLAAEPQRRAGEAGDAIRIERTSDVLRISLQRPERRNAYSARMRDELVDALELAVADPTIDEVHIDGTGPDFCSGGDLAEFGTVTDPAFAHHIRMTRNAGWWMHRVSSRTTVRVHGACVGAGVELAAFARRVVAAPGTTFRLPEVGMGLIPGAGGTASIPRRIGRERATWFALCGQALDTAAALRWGLVDEILPGA